MNKKSLIEHFKHKQFHWDVFYPNMTVAQMMNLHKGIEVAEEAPEYVVILEKHRDDWYRGSLVKHG